MESDTDRDTSPPVNLDTKLALIIFTRYPTPGTVKTRLIPAVGADGAANLHRQMTENTLRQARELAAQLPISIAKIIV